MKRTAKILCLFLICSTTFTILGCSEKQESNPSILDEYPEGEYVVGKDIPEGEYVIFASSGDGKITTYTDTASKNEDDWSIKEYFSYNYILDLSDAECIELDKCYAVPIANNPEIDITNDGMYKVGVHIPSGTYRIIPDLNNEDSFYYEIQYSDGTEVDSDMIDLARVSTYELSNGDYIKVQSGWAVNDSTDISSIISENAVNMTDDEKLDTANLYYEEAFFDIAIDYLKTITNANDDTNELITKATLMQQYQGIYKSSLTKDGEYYVLKGWYLDNYNFNAYTSSGVSYSLDHVGLEQYEGQYYLVSEDYDYNIEGALEVYALIETDDKSAQALDLIYVGNDLDVLYIKDDTTTIEDLDKRYYGEANKLEPSIGMTAEEVCNSTWGEPNKINKTTTEYGTSEQWVYGGGRYIYLDDGIVTAIQE